MRDLRDHLSAYLERVKDGETITITEHGRPIARLVRDEPLSPHMLKLVADGTADARDQAVPALGGHPACSVRRVHRGPDGRGSRRLIAYLDSSAILKHYLLDEPGLAEVHGVATESGLVATSRLSFVEVRAGLAAARRSNRLDRASHDRAVVGFIEAWFGFDVVDLSDGDQRACGSHRRDIRPASGRRYPARIGAGA